jgi:hypothetical protein
MPLRCLAGQEFRMSFGQSPQVTGNWVLIGPAYFHGVMHGEFRDTSNKQVDDSERSEEKYPTELITVTLE